MGTGFVCRRVLARWRALDRIPGRVPALAAAGRRRHRADRAHPVRFAPFAGASRTVAPRRPVGGRLSFRSVREPGGGWPTDYADYGRRSGARRPAFWRPLAGRPAAPGFGPPRRPGDARPDPRA